VSPLARIEIVMFLREVELFHFCDAEEVLRIAAITRERHLSAGERIYGFNEASESLYCIVSGEIRLETEAGEAHLLGRRATFGVRGILSGRLRTTQAIAEADTLALVIDAEDFYDLLSNNIDIVKALFRQITTPAEGRDTRPLQ